MSIPPVLCIAGMSRSCTSLVSSLLQSSGLHIGERLMAGGASNPKGHFEDLDFFEFHVQVLESQGIHPTGFTLQRELQFREQHLLAARRLVEVRRQRQLPWGWKDPRTTLFLDFWQQMIPEANFLILYRCPWDVVDSLFRRGDEVFRSNPSFAVGVWGHYNRLLIDFHDRFPERCLCVNSYRVIQSPTLLLEALRNKFNLQLAPVADLFDPDLLHRTTSSRWASLVQHHFPEAADLYEQLNERARQTPRAGESLAAERDAILPIEDWACHDWLNLRILEGQHRELRLQLEKSESELTLSQNQLNRDKAEIASLRQELDQTQARFHAFQTRVATMENSRFWKMRSAWVRAKSYLRRAA